MKRELLLIFAACGTNQTPQPAPVPALPDCVPNRDGTITADELPIALGFTLDYYAGANRTVSLSGPVYDFSQERPDDTVVAIGPVALAAQWYAGSFSAGQFVVDAGGGLDGIYHQDSTGLWLDGSASQQPGANKTLIVYPNALPVLRFPLADGDAWSTTAPLTTATIAGLPFQGSDELDVDVAAGTRLDVPYVEFSPVLRVRTHAIRTPSTGTPVVSKRTTILLFECFGEVARAESAPNEPNADFTQATYVRKFALGVSP